MKVRMGHSPTTRPHGLSAVQPNLPVSVRLQLPVSADVLGCKTKRRGASGSQRATSHASVQLKPKSDASPAHCRRTRLRIASFPKESRCAEVLGRPHVRRGAFAVSESQAALRSAPAVPDPPPARHRRTCPRKPSFRAASKPSSRSCRPPFPGASHRRRPWSLAKDRGEFSGQRGTGRTSAQPQPNQDAPPAHRLRTCRRANSP